jgi:dihydropteroate synthase
MEGVADVRRVLPLRQQLWRTGERTRVMAIFNCTPDSFSDGGAHWRAPGDAAAVEAAAKLVDEGADILDVGGESTRPGAQPVGEQEELARVVPLIAALRRHADRKVSEGVITRLQAFAYPECAAAELAAQVADVPISIDTYKASVAEAAVRAGADMVNDVSGGAADPAMAETVARLGVPFVVMHSRATPQTMASAEHCTYANLIDDAVRELQARVDHAERCGVPRWNIVVDPGLGFAKKPRQSLELLHPNALRTVSTGFPLLCGASRKGFIGRVLQDLAANSEPRKWGSLATVAAAVAGGADIVRVHDVKESVAVARMCDAVWRQPPSHL